MLEHDKLTGEANFDIDNEKINTQIPSLFEQFNIPTKIQIFEKILKKKILDGSLNSGYNIYLFSLNEGFLPQNANKVLKQLKEESKINYDFKPISGKIHKINFPNSIKLNNHGTIKY